MPGPFVVQRSGVEIRSRIGQQRRMPAYRINIATFDVPDTWVDQSITAFRLPAPAGGSEASFVVTRDAGKGVAPFDGYVSGQIDSLSRSLPEFALVKSDRMTANDRDAAWVEFTWVKDRQPMQLRQIFFDCGFFATICTLTSTPRDMPFFDQTWRALMGSLVFDRVDPAPAFP